MIRFYLISTSILLAILMPKYAISQQFTEVSEALGIDHYYSDWNSIGGGTAFFDYDADGDDDLYVTGGLLSDQLYRNNGDGTFTNVTEGSGIQLTETYFTTGVTTGDIDNDGYKDIFVTTFGFITSLGPDKRNLLFKNMGDGTFQEIAPLANLSDASRSVSATFLDHDQDGFLDLYVVNYVDRIRFIYDQQGNVAGFDHDCYDNFFYHNNGNSTFTQVAEELLLADIGCGLAVVNTDYDMDGDADLYLANDFGEFVQPNRMFVNNLNTGVFETLSLNNEINIGLYGMGIAISDYDLDLDYDYYVSNLGANALLNNDGSGVFTNQANAANVSNTATTNDLLVTSWGTAFADIDNNIYEDLLVSNGHIPASEFIATDPIDPNKLYYNNGDGTFSDISEISGFNTPEKCRGLAYSDYDNDGDIDVFVNVMLSDSFPEAHVRLYRNDLVNDNNWVQFNLQGTQANRDAIGAQVRLYVDDLILLREISGGGSHASQNSTTAHFGLADYTEFDSVQVVWPGGDSESFYDLDINQRHTLVQGLEERVRVTFTVDMSFQEASSEGVFIKMTDVDGATRRKLMYSPFQNDQYSVSFLEEPGFSGFYTILNGSCPDESCAENLSEEGCDDLTMNFERILPPVFDDTSINLCYGICSGLPCQSTVDSFMVSFTLNAAPLDEDLESIFLRGISPDGQGLPMNDPDGDGIFELSMNLAENLSAYYTYANGDCTGAACLEDLSGQGCTSEENFYYRYLPPLTQDTMLNACFGVCNTDSCFAPIDTFRLLINLNMTNQDQNPTGVFIVGDYFGLPGATPLFDGDDDGIFTNFFDLPEGFTTYFTFSNGSNCGTDCYEDLSGQSCAEVDENNFRFFGPLTSDTVLNLCFDDCQLAACLPPTDSVDITFELNMAPVETSLDGVYWLDDFDAPGEFPLLDPEGDDTYTITIRRPEGYSTYYSFANGLCSDQSCREDLEDQDCADPFELNYRLLEPVFSDTLLSLCFGSCETENCVAPIDSVDIQINVNTVALEEVSPQGLFLVEGAFGAPGTYPLTDIDGDGVYTTTIRQPEGFGSFYSFTNGNCPDLSCKEDLTGQDCGPPNANNNRWLAPVMQDTIINTCFAECTPDLDCTLPPAPVDIVFTVSMLATDPAPAGIYLTGDFGLTENEFLLTNSGGILWTTTLSITPGNYYYRFVNGTPIDGDTETLEDDVLNNCSEIVEGVRQRTLAVLEDQPIMLDTVCFNECVDCIIDNTNQALAELLILELHPNPASDFSRLICRNTPWAQKQVQLINAVGQVVETYQLEAGQNDLTFSTVQLPAGVYWVSLEIKGLRLVEKLIIQ